MYELSLAHLSTTDREREIDAELRRRQILKAPTAPTAPADSVETHTIAASAGRRLSTNLRTSER